MAAMTKTKKTAAMTKTKTEVNKKIEVNGSYEFLVGHFVNPSTIIDVATALAQHSKIDPQIAAKKVEQFLENAKLDQTLEVRAGTGSNEGQYIIARVPQGAQKATTERRTSMKPKKAMKTTEKKDTTMHLKVTEGTLRAGNKRGASIQFWTTGYHSIDAAVEHLKKQFPNESDAKLRSAATEIFRNTGLRDRLKVKVLKKDHGDTPHYTVVAAA